MWDWVRLAEFEREAADGAAIEEIGFDEEPPVGGEESEHAIQRILDACPGRFEEHRRQTLEVTIKHGEEEVLLRGEEVVEASAVDVSRLQHVGDSASTRLTITV